nr:MAG TPA: hypothetical protein [Caudoviricetes sp.]
MSNHSYNAAYSQLQNVNDNSCINPCYLIMFLNKKFVYLRSMVRVAVFTCVYTLAVNERIQANINDYNNNRCIQSIYTIVIYPLFENI